MACLAAPLLADYAPPPEPLPRSGGATVFANGNLYWYLGRSGTNVTDSAGKFYNLDYASPGISIFNPSDNTWSSSRWDGTGPLGMDQDGNGLCEWNSDPGRTGIWLQTNQGFAFDYDADGVDEIFSIGGFPLTGRNCPIYLYDGNTGGRGSWSYVGEMGSNFDQFRRGAVGLYGTKVFIASGGGTGAKFGSYDLASGTVETYADGPSSDYNAHVVLNGKLYVIGGSADAGTSVWECDITGYPAWSNGGAPVATLNTGVRCAQAVAYNGSIYVLGGLASGGPTNVIQQFTPVGAFPYAVTTLTDTLPAAMYSHGAAVDPATGTLFVGGGGREGSDAARPSVLAATWWKCDLDELKLSFVAMPDDPSYFPCDDYAATGSQVSGKVTLADGTPLGGALVGIKRKPSDGADYKNPCADPNRILVTDANGNFGPTLLAPVGEFYIGAWKEGLDPAPDTIITVNEAGDPVTANMVLTDAAGRNLAVAEPGRTPYRESNGAPERVVEAFDNDPLPLRDWFGQQTRGDGTSMWWAAAPSSGYVYIAVDLADMSDIKSFLVDGCDILWDDALATSYRVDITDGIDQNSGEQYNQPMASGELDPQYDAYYGLTWTTVYETTSANPWTVKNPGGWDYWWCHWAPIRWPAQQVRAVRIVMTQANWRGGYGIWDWQIHSADRYDQQVVCGRVTDPSGNPIPEAKLRLDGQFAQRTVCFTDENGFYYYNVNNPGVHQLQVDAIGYKNLDGIVAALPAATPVIKHITLPVRPDETNLAYNWSFETEGGATGADGWTVREDDPQGEIGFARTTSWVHSGTAAMSSWGNFADKGKGADMMSNLFPVPADQSKTYSLSYFKSGVNGDIGWERDYFGFRWYAADGTTQIGESWYGWYGDNAVTEAMWWHNYNLDRAVPPVGAAYGRAFIGVWYGNWDGQTTPGTQLYDDVRVDAADRLVYKDLAAANVGDVVSIEGGCQLTAMPGAGVPADAAYIEAKDRTSGMRVDTSGMGGPVTFVGVGDEIRFVGTVKEAATGERYVACDAMYWMADLRPLDALGMNNRFAATSLARGLFVKLWGEVKSTGTDYFTISDGAGDPIKVLCGMDRLKVPMPAVGDKIRVRGVLSTDPTKVELLMNPEAVDWVLADSAFQPFAMPGPVKALRDYVLVGPFRTDGAEVAAMMDTDYISEATAGAETEETVQPSAGDALGSLAWKRHDGLDELVDINRIIGYNENCVAYAAAYIWSPITQPVDLIMGSDDMLKVWLNGSLVLSDYGWRGVNYGQMPIYGVTLQAGFNRLLCKVGNGGGGFAVVTQVAQPGTYTGEGWGGCTPMEGLGYLPSKP